MTAINSYDLYCQACQIGVQYFSHKYHGGRSVGYDMESTLEEYYIRIINTLFYELITKKKSQLLSYLCSVNKVFPDVKNFRIEEQRCAYRSTYDIIPILEGINISFTKDLNECRYLYKHSYKKCTFTSMEFSKESDFQQTIVIELRNLDKNIGNAILNFSETQKESEQKRGANMVREPKVKAADIICRIHDPKLTEKLNRYADERRVYDISLSEQIQQLQVSLQDELKQIMSIRDGIDYNIAQEAVSQFISLFHLVDETLRYHPNDENKDSYHNLIESCEDFLENIMQSLAMLGVILINDVGEPFNIEKHRLAPGRTPVREAIVSKVTKLGFIYKNKIIEKAEVEITEDKA